MRNHHFYMKNARKTKTCVRNTKIFVRKTKNCVRKNKNTGNLVVASIPIAVKSVTGISLFPDQDSPHNFCYLVVDPQRRSVKYWSAAFVDFW